MTYYVTDNELSKKFHQNICKETKQVTVTGIVKKVDGRLELTPVKMVLVQASGEASK